MCLIFQFQMILDSNYSRIGLSAYKLSLVWVNDYSLVKKLFQLYTKVLNGG